MLSTAAQLLSQLDAAYWIEKLPRSHVDTSRSIESIEPLLALRLLMGEKISVTGMILLFDEGSFEALEVLSEERLVSFMTQLITDEVPLVAVSCSTQRYPRVLKALEKSCLEKRVGVIQTQMSFFQLCLDLQKIREKLQVHSLEVHGTMVDVFGLGVLLMGASGIGKSETALGLIERRHRLIGDDLIRLVKQGQSLMASAAQMTRHHMEIRGIGILNIAHMFGIVSVEETKRLDMVVELESWSAEQDYDRMGLEWHYSDFLEVMIPHHRLPVKPGRDLVLLIETMALNHRLRQMGFNSAKEMQQRLQDEIDKQSKGRQSLSGWGTLS